MTEERTMLIQGARVIDPYRQVDREEDVWIQNGQVVGPQEHAHPLVVNARGLWLIPRIIDMHVHFREPGQTWKETVRTGMRAAAHGGVTTVAVMPNTDPVIDSPELVEWLGAKEKILRLGRIIPIGAVTVKSQGAEMADLYRMWKRGARGFSDDGRPVASAELMRSALQYVKGLTAPLINHAQDPALSAGGVVQEGLTASQLGLPGMPEAAEAVMVWRDVVLAGLTGGHLHVAHVSAQESLEALAYASRRHYPVSAEATPHHLLLSDEALWQWGYQAATKVNPPLRSEPSRRALVDAVRQGLVSVLASDHAPHHEDEKRLPYTEAPFGISGLETLLAVLITALIGPGHLSLLDAWSLVTRGPSQVLGLHYQGLTPGMSADLTLVDPNARWTVDPAKFESMGHNTPLAGMELVGQAVATMVDGRWIMQEGEVSDDRVSTIL